MENQLQELQQIQELEQISHQMKQKSKRNLLLSTSISIAMIALAITLLLLATNEYNRLQTDISNLKIRKADLEKIQNNLETGLGELNQTVSSLNKEIEDLREEQARVAQASSQNITSESSEKATITIFLANQSQRTKAEEIQKHLTAEGHTVTIKDRRNPPLPYSTEVRFFRYPEDIKIAQHVLDVLQSPSFEVINSRISYVVDSRDDPQTLEIHFNNQSYGDTQSSGIWFPVIYSIYDKARALSKARELNAKNLAFEAHVYQAADKHGERVYAVTLGGSLTEAEARRRVDYARQRVDLPNDEYTWPGGATWGTNLLSDR